MIRINQNKSIDPTFGKLSQDIDRVYHICVTPKSHNFSWVFFILFPKLESDATGEERENLMQEIVESITHDVCEEGDKCRIYELEDKDLSKYKLDTPVIAYDDYVEDFVWLKPPKHVMS